MSYDVLEERWVGTIGADSDLYFPTIKASDLGLSGWFEGFGELRVLSEAWRIGRGIEFEKSQVYIACEEVSHLVAIGKIRNTTK